MTDKEIRRLGRDDLLNMLVGQNKEVKRLKGERDSLITQLRYFEGEFNRIGSLDAILARMGIRTDAADGAKHVSALEELLRQFENEDSTQDLFDEDIEANAPAAGEKPAGKRPKRSLNGSLKRLGGQKKPEAGTVATASKEDKSGADVSRENGSEAEDAVANASAQDWNRFPARADAVNEKRSSFANIRDNDEISARAGAANEKATDLLTDDMDAEEDFSSELPEVMMGAGEAQSYGNAGQQDANPAVSSEDENADARAMRKPGFMKGAGKQSRVQEAFAWAKMQFRDKKKE